MRGHIVTTESRSTLVRRLLIACVAMAAISTSSFATVTRADVPGGGGNTIRLFYFGVLYEGNNQWMAEGVVQAQNMSGVSIQFSGASNQSAVPDAQGYFSIVFSATAGQDIIVDATNSTGTAHGKVTLDNFELFHGTSITAVSASSGSDTSSSIR